MPRELEEMYEIELYFIIDACGAFIWNINHSISHGRISKGNIPAINKDIVRTRKQQTEAIQTLNKKYGNELFLKEEKPTEEYFEWYKKWNKWHRGMSDERWKEVDKILLAGLSEKQANDLRNEAFKLNNGS